MASSDAFPDLSTLKYVSRWSGMTVMEIFRNAFTVSSPVFRPWFEVLSCEEPLGWDVSNFVVLDVGLGMVSNGVSISA